MHIEEDRIGVSCEVVGSIASSRDTVENTDVCEKKLVKESEIAQIRYSPLCRQVGES